MTRHTAMLTTCLFAAIAAMTLAPPALALSELQSVGLQIPEYTVFDGDSIGIDLTDPPDWPDSDEQPPEAHTDQGPAKRLDLGTPRTATSIFALDEFRAHDGVFGPIVPTPSAAPLLSDEFFISSWPFEARVPRTLPDVGLSIDELLRRTSPRISMSSGGSSFTSIAPGPSATIASPVPTPGAVTLLGIGALIGSRRRRR